MQVSAVTACDYLQGVWPPLHVVGASVSLLLLFAVVVVMGMKESATVATGIFVLHVFTLCMIVLLGAVYAVGTGLGELPQNLRQPFPTIDTVGWWTNGWWFVGVQPYGRHPWDRASVGLMFVHMWLWCAGHQRYPRRLRHGAALRLLGG
jgi:amino acid transporter